MDKLPYYELEELLDSLKELANKEEEERKKKEGSQTAPSMNVNSLTKQMSNQTGIHVPNLPNFKL